MNHNAKMTTQTLTEKIWSELTKERHNKTIDLFVGGAEFMAGLAILPAPLGGRELYNRGLENIRSIPDPEAGTNTSGNAMIFYASAFLPLFGFYYNLAITVAHVVQTYSKTDFNLVPPLFAMMMPLGMSIAAYNANKYGIKSKPINSNDNTEGEPI
jgi:hypothetical protein